MGNATNVLILSCGTRNKIIQYFRKELGNNGIVIAADCSDLAPALYDADKYFVIPRINEKEYLKKVISICNCNKVKGILSLIDPELTLLARNKKEFLSIGVTPIISGHETVELCFDKYAMYKFLATNGFNTPKSYVDKDKFFKDVEVGVINYPVFLKPIKGSASININKAFCKEEVELLFSKYDGLMIQEFIDGIEYGADVYIDMISGEPVAIFTKEKIKMRAGETDKALSFKEENLFQLIQAFVKVAGFRGIIDIDIFKVNNDYYISEINPRFGGGYPHAHECGVNIIRMILNNIKGIENVSDIGNYKNGIYMMKYFETIIKNDQLNNESD